MAAWGFIRACAVMDILSDAGAHTLGIDETDTGVFGVSVNGFGIHTAFTKQELITTDERLHQFLSEYLVNITDRPEWDLLRDGEATNEAVRPGETMTARISRFMMDRKYDPWYRACVDGCQMTLMLRYGKIGKSIYTGRKRETAGIAALRTTVTEDSLLRFSDYINNKTILTTPNDWGRVRRIVRLDGQEYAHQYEFNIPWKTAAQERGK